jgi:nuclear pore complex protein Nup107
LYGAVSGASASVVPVCSTWEDHTWALVNALFEERVDVGLEQVEEGRFWNDDVSASRNDDIGIIDIDGGAPAPTADGTFDFVRDDIKTSLQNIFNRVSKLPRIAETAFHVAQSRVILDRADTFLLAMAQKLETAEDEERESEYGSLCPTIQIMH